jgi:hypothetical protein
LLFLVVADFCASHRLLKRLPADLNRGIPKRL